MALQSSTKRAGSLLVTVLFFILAFVSYTTFVQPEIDTITELRGELKSKTELLEQQKTVSDQVGNLLSRFKSVKNLEDIVSMAIPVEEDLGPLLNQLNILSRSSGLDVSAISFRSLSLPRSRPVRGRSSIKSLSDRGTAQVSLSMTGSYSALKSFLRLLETNVRVLDLQELSIKSVDRSFTQNQYDYDVTVNAYFQVQNEEE